MLNLENPSHFHLEAGGETNSVDKAQPWYHFDLPLFLLSHFPLAGKGEWEVCKANLCQKFARHNIQTNSGHFERNRDFLVNKEKWTNLQLTEKPWKLPRWENRSRQGRYENQEMGSSVSNVVRSSGSRVLCVQGSTEITQDCGEQWELSVSRSALKP